MGCLFGHYAGDEDLSEKAIATLQEYDEFFRKNTPADYGRAPLKHQLLKHKQRLYNGIPVASYRFTIRDASNLSQVFVFSGLTSTVDWAASMSARRLMLTGLVAVAPETLYPKIPRDVRLIDHAQ